MFKGIDFYSDTVTRPTAGMREAIANADVGDEQKGEDPTTNRLEKTVASLLGFSGATFFPSATLANEVALRLLSEPGDEVLAAEDCHLFFAEAGGPAVHAGLMVKAIRTPSGVFTADQVQAAFNPRQGPHYPVSKILSIENTTNMGGGVAWPLDTLKSVVQKAKSLGLKLHLDGSRLMNAAVSSDVAPKTLTEGFDTATICLSKGLGCPAGAVLSYDVALFPKVRRLKQLFGGALRQSGILAAAGLYALENHVSRLKDDHENALRLATLLSEIPECRVENLQPSTNMVFFRWSHPRLSIEKFMDLAESRGVRFSRVGPDRLRAVLHLDISKDDVERAVPLLKEII